MAALETAEELYAPASDESANEKHESFRAVVEEALPRQLKNPEVALKKFSDSDWASAADPLAALKKLLISLGHIKVHSNVC